MTYASTTLSLRLGYSVFQSINRIERSGGFAHVSLGLTLPSNMTMWGPNVVADIPSGYWPLYYPSTFAVSRGGVWCVISLSNNTIQIQPFAESVKQGDTIIFDTSWVIEV